MNRGADEFSDLVNWHRIGGTVLAEAQDRDAGWAVVGGCTGGGGIGLTVAGHREPWRQSLLGLALIISGRRKSKEITIHYLSLRFGIFVVHFGK